MRGDQLSRQWRLILMLEGRRTGATVAELAEELNVSPRTVYRDLEVLQEIGLPLETEREGANSVWRMLETHRWRLGTPLSVSEVVALQVAGRLLADHGGTPWGQALAAALDKVKAAVPGKELARLSEHLSAVSTSDRGGHAYDTRGEIVGAVGRALAEQRVLDVQYQSFGRSKPTARRLRPYRLHLHDRGLYLIAHDDLRGEVRTFLVDRILLATVSDERYELPESFDVEAYFADAFAVFRGGEAERLVARIAPDLARLVTERQWHPSQKLRHLPDGSVRLELQVSITPELKAWLLSFGASLEVLAPGHLADAIAEEAIRMAQPRVRRPRSPDLASDRARPDRG